MKKIVETSDAAGLEALALKSSRVMLMCRNYFYAGKLVGINSSFVMLEDAEIIYDTDKAGKATQRGALPSKTWYVVTASIESYGEMN